MKLNVTDRTGKLHEVECEPKGVIMEVLRDLDYGVLALCGGMMACGTCHVYIRDEDLARLPEQSENEKVLLEGLCAVRPNSRLSCQIPLRQDLDGLPLTIAPEE